MAIQILIVDDEPQFERLVLQRFRRELREGAYQFVFAENGLMALEKIEQYPGINMVLTDINMPVMDGLTFLSKLKEKRPLLKTVVVSAYGDMKNIRNAMNLGAFDFVTKPIDFGDLKITILKTLEEAELIKNAEQARELTLRNEKLQELDQLKSHFFTNISHELRTPLTIITGVAGQLHEDPFKWGRAGIEMIQRNSRRLLDLVNQILDLRKLEAGRMQLQFIQADVLSLCNYIVDSFRFLAESAGIQLHFQPAVQSLYMDYDVDKLLRILSNLLSNAIKHTASGGLVSVSVSEASGPGPQLEIKISDTGCGISADQLPFIFDRFYQGPSPSPLPPSGELGTGVGLSLVNELVLLMHGKIRVESEVGRGTTFTLHLPIRNNAPLSELATPSSVDAKLTLDSATDASVAATTVVPAISDEQLPSLLIVEDNEDVILHLLHCLGNQYQPIIARNGREGIEKALDQIPDIIISDVMMPEKDGFELCEALKTDERTSHIPIVLLTAKVDVDNRIAGLRRGADAYLGKPFDKKELGAVLMQLLQLRAALRERYASLEISTTKNTEEAAYNFSLEDAFVQKARQLVVDHLNDSTFSVQHFCHGLGMSYSVVHRKLSALADRSPALFIRAVRLQQAKSMLGDASRTISEIAYDSGFNDPKYFSRAFSEEFGAPPSTFRN
ncbi:MAG: response regulator [Phaeodactylibacter sp.]|nr:response regulator [Phaeodactylibacter sp.]